MRALGWFWAAVLAVCAVGALVLHSLGPLPQPAAAAPDRPVASAPLPAAAVPGPMGVSGPGSDQPIRISDAIPTLLDGALPRIGPDGRRPMDAYARPFDRADTRPRIALILVGLGLPGIPSADAIRLLPSGVTFAVSPAGVDVSPLLDQARQKGDELLVSIPMQASLDATDRPGLAERELRADLPADLNNFRLAAALSRFTGYVGATGATDGQRGERYAASPQRVAALGRSLADRGLLYIDPRPGVGPIPGVASRAIDLIVDDPPGRAEIEAKLIQLERLARERGSVLALAGPPRPALLERLAAWTAGLPARGLVLAPVSAVVPPPR